MQPLTLKLYLILTTFVQIETLLEANKALFANKRDSGTYDSTAPNGQPKVQSEASKI